MTTSTPEVLRIDVGDAELAVVRWHGRTGVPAVFAAHGITANAWSWSAVARHLDGDVTLVAVDLRGRGGSHAAPGPFGMRRHADDLATIVDRFSAAPTVVAGHSMGAYVALAAAERHPAQVDGLVLVDAGPAIPVPDGLAPEQALDAIVGPAIERLGTVWPDRVSYRTTWSEHPAFSEGLTPEIERYVLGDLTPCAGGFRSIVNEAAVRFDGEELLTDQEMRGLLERRRDQVTILRAPAGINGAPPPLIPAEWVGWMPRHDWRLVPRTNHYTVLVGEAGAAAVAAAIREKVSSPA